MKSIHSLSPALLWFLAGMILANVAAQMTFTFFPVYFASLGASVPQIGFMYTLAAVVPLLLQILGGWLSDTIGRLRTIAIGSLGGLAGYIGLYLAPTWEWALLALCLEFISGSMVGPSFGAYIAEQSSEEDRGRTFGVAMGVFEIVTVVGPITGGLIAGKLGFKTLMLAGAIVYAAATLLRIWMSTNARFNKPFVSDMLHFSHLKSNLVQVAAMITAGGILTWIFITDGIRDIALRLSTDLQPLFMSQIGGLTLEQIGWLTALVGIALMASMFIGGYLSDRLGERLTIAAGFGLQAVGITVFVSYPSLGGFTGAAILFGLGRGIMSPAYDALVSKVVPEKQRGLVFGLTQTSLGMFSLPAPWVGAQLWQRFSAQLPFQITAAAAFLSIIPVWLKFKLIKSGSAVKAAPEVP